ncbi:hypothetical protein ACFOY2_46120 [Nonomuraea purpurea]|uniref:Uncharacterized protein n=1 Tax=Nonomuraea purpurea TaxID=1849276 RepID=A0ABV8GNR5_9ACTN
MHVTERARYTVEIALDSATTPNLADRAGNEFTPTIAEIKWEWTPSEGWQRWITVVGYRLRKNGSIGRRTSFHCETPHSPDAWLLPAKYQALADATSPASFPLPA